MAEGEPEVRWDGLCSRDPAAREAALEHVRQVVRRKTEDLRSGGETSRRPPDGLSDAVPADGLNKLLAHLLMLSKRCPFKDVREKSEHILKSVQVRRSRMITPACRVLCSFTRKYSLRVCLSQAVTRTLTTNSLYSFKFRVLCKTLNLESKLYEMN